MIKYKNGLQGNLTIPDVEKGVIPDYQTFPLTSFHEKDARGNIKAQPDPSAAARGRNFDIENKK